MAEIDERAGLRAEVIKHLSSEIQNQSQYLMTFRSRIAFTVLVGPFIVLGSVLVAAKTTAANPWDWFDTILCILLSIISLLSCYKSNRISWLTESVELSWESDG